MRLEALSKAIMFYGMDDVFNILPSETVKLLESKLDVLFTSQELINVASDFLATNPGNQVFRNDLSTAVAAGDTAIAELESVSLEPTNLLKNYKGISEEEVRTSKLILFSIRV